METKKVTRIVRIKSGWYQAEELMEQLKDYPWELNINEYEELTVTAREDWMPSIENTLKHINTLLYLR